MLNRRTLRIKVLQQLYALERSIEANRMLAEDEISEAFSPDLNSMEPQPVEDLRKMKRQALQLYRSRYGGMEMSAQEVSEEIVKVVDLAATHVAQHNREDTVRHRKLMLSEVQRMEANYIRLLQLLIEFRDVHEQEKSQRPQIKSTRFLENPYLKLLEEDAEFRAKCRRLKVNWGQNAQEVRNWKKQWVNESEAFIAYQTADRVSEDDHLKIVLDLVSEVIFGAEPIEDFMAADDLYWEENKKALKSMIKKTMKSMDPAASRVTLLDLTSNWEDDAEFFTELFDQTVRNGSEDETLIQEKLKNWDLERITPIDRIMLRMALNEMIYFHSIPVKVTINEYIEISKKYSTPKSKQFINGLLDVLAEELQQSGKIKKSGRGLIDNK